MRIVMLWIFMLIQGFTIAQKGGPQLGRFSVDQLQGVINNSSSSDSVVVAYSILARKLITVDNNASTIFYKTALEEIGKYEGPLNKDSIFNYTKLQSAISLINGTHYAKANKVLQEQQEYYEETKNPKQVAHALILKGFLLTEISNFAEAADHFLRAGRIYEEIDFVGGMNDADNRMGIIYTALQDYGEAAEYYNKVVDRCEERNSTFLLTAATNNLAESYTRLGDTINAKKWSLKIIEIRKAYSNNQNMSYLYKNMSDYAFLNNNMEQGIIYLDSSLYFAKLMNVPSQIIEKKLYLSRKYKEIGNLEKQKEMLISAVADLEKTDLSVHKTDLYEDLAQYYQQIGEYEKASDFFGKFIRGRESLDKLSGERELKKKEEHLKILTYNQKISNFEKDRAIEALELKKQRQRNNFLWLFFLMSLAALIYLLKNVRDKKKSQEILFSQKKKIADSLRDKEILLKEIHHRVKNNLQVVSSMLNLNLRYVNDKAAKEILLESRNRVKSMALIHQKLYQEEHLKGVKLKSYLESLVNNLLHSYKQNSGELTMHYDVEEMVLDVDTLIPFGLIVNEILTNSLKHAFSEKEEGNVWIYVKKEDEILVLRIRDDGVGFDRDDATKSSVSFGMSLIDSLAEKLKADVIITNNKGTTVELKIKKFSMYN